MTTQPLFVHNENELFILAAKIAAHLTSGMIIALQGELGVGKTTFSRGILRALGYNGIVKSPSYTIVESYYLENITVHHMDLYRLSEAHELSTIGFKDYLSSTAILLIEWPERAQWLLTQSDLIVTFNIKASGRLITLAALSAAGQRVLDHAAVS